MSTYPLNPDRNTPWNNLPDLPIDSSLYRTVDIYEQLGKAKEALGKLQGRSIAIPNQGLLINTISLQEAKASSAIENIFTTDDELYQAYSEHNEEAISGAPKEVLRYREALWSGLRYLKQNQFDRNYFIQIYREIKQATDGIRPPFAQIVIKRGSTGPHAGQVIYTPPRGTGVLEAKLDNLASFMNDRQTYSIDPLIKMAIGHYQFEVIHPFRDGNGRAGRIFIIHYLTQQGLLDLPILFLSKYIIDHKSDYYAYLSGVSARGDWEKWLIYMLRAVEVTANITYQKINDILSTKEAILKVIESDTDIRRPEQLVELIFRQPYTKVKHLTESNTYAENTARNYLNKLVDLSISEKRTIRGHHYYLNTELFRILSE
ncbi:MAG: Fic family protein [Cyclobacteriaceae bacterium]|nr:Fic family protein [Cyclobacteriaceae bacterium HetDA_MAG_MS6]